MNAYGIFINNYSDKDLIKKATFHFYENILLSDNRLERIKDVAINYIKFLEKNNYFEVSLPIIFDGGEYEVEQICGHTVKITALNPQKFKCNCNCHENKKSDAAKSQRSKK